MRLCAEQLHTRLQMDLYEAGWTDSGIYPGIPQRQLAMNAISQSLLKKFHNDETDVVRDEKALQLFLSCNEACRVFDGPLPRRLDEELILNEMKLIIDQFFNPNFRVNSESHDPESYREPLLLNLSDIATHFGLGNGSNIGSSSTDFYTKLVNSKMSYTNSVLPLLFRQAISRDKLWTGIETFRSARFGTEVVRGSRLSFVPKSRVISRTICTEPLLNMLFQKGIAGVLEGRLREVFKLDLSLQPFRNRRLARMGSVDDRFGTIDLSSASDSISISLLRAIMPKEPLDWLMRCRSPITILPDGREVELHMISSMGNGYTFPLQTMIFSALVLAAYKVYGIHVEYPNKLTDGNFAVFGDDIIVDRRVYDAVVRCLGVIGFTVNKDKSFNLGLFRESCGADFWNARDIRGVYIKKLLTAGDIYSAINRLNRWSSYHGILLSRTVGYLRGGCRFLGVPYDEADDAGIKVPFSLLRTPTRNANGAIKYNALVNVSRSVRVPSVEFECVELPENELRKIRVLLPNFEHFADGLLFVFLAGWLRNGQLGLRTLQPKAVLRRRVCPGWDESIARLGITLDEGEALKLFTSANLL